MKTLNPRSIIILALALACFADFAHAQNLLRNPAFEEVQDGMPVGWRPRRWAGRADFTIDEAGRAGRAARITSPGGADAGLTQTVAVPPFARLRLSGWIRTENLSPTTGRGIQLSVDAFEGAYTRPLVGSNDWTRLEVEFQTLGQSSIEIICLFGGWGQATGAAWIDDMELVVIEEGGRPESRTINAQISIDPVPRDEPISPFIFGQFIEHLGRCIYGGIWAEMIEDRKFLYPVPADGDIWVITDAGARVLRASPWRVIGSRENVVMNTEDPLSGDHEPKITVARGRPGGIYQEELGLIRGMEYTGRIVLRGDTGAGPIRVSLIWGEGEADRQTVTIGRPTRNFRAHNLKYKSGADTENARLEIVGAGGGAFIVGAVSLMPADNVYGFRRDTLELLKELNSPIYRWPGGNFVSGYDWRDGIGDRDRRPTRMNPAWGGIEPNDVGMHEFIKLCRLLGAEPMITVNTGFGDAHSAAAQVEYANSCAADTLWGGKRAANGHPEPFDVRYWCVGNEMWGDWQLGFMALHQYVRKHNWVEEMMREVDPTIVTIASGDIGGGWSEGMLRHSHNYMDHIAEHFYAQSRADLTAHTRQLPNGIRARADAHRRFRERMPMLQGRDIRIAMTEWNHWYGPHVFGELGTRYFMNDALGVAAGLHEYFRNSEMFHSAFYAQTVNVIGAIKTTKTEAEFDATAFPLILYRREFGNQPLRVSGWTERLDVVAALTEDGEYLTIGVVNATWDTYRVSLDLGGLMPAGRAAGWTIQHDNPMAHNHPGEERVIDIAPLEPTDITGALSIKPISITLFRAPLR